MGTQLWGALLINSGFGISANYDPCIFDFNVLYNCTVCIQVLFVNVRLIIIKTCYLIIKLIQRTLDKWFGNSCEFYHRKINIINSSIINEKSLSLISYFIPLLGIPSTSEKRISVWKPQSCNTKPLIRSSTQPLQFHRD